MLNDQFEEGNKRPEIVVVECRIAKSEIDASKRNWSAYNGAEEYDYEAAKNDPTRPYFARYAKNSTGEHQWKSGPIAGQMRNFSRSVYMTRWIQPVRIVPNSEVAQHIAELYRNENSDTLRLYWNTINPEVLQYLDELGVPIEPYGSPNYLVNGKTDRYGNPIPPELRKLRDAEKQYKKILDDAKKAKTQATKDRHLRNARAYYQETLAPAMDALKRVERQTGVRSSYKYSTEDTEDVGNIQYSTRDSEYLELAKDPEGNRAELQQMVDEAARTAGYTATYTMVQHIATTRIAEENSASTSER